MIKVNLGQLEIFLYTHSLVAGHSDELATLSIVKTDKEGILTTAASKDIEIAKVKQAFRALLAYLGD